MNYLVRRPSKLATRLPIAHDWTGADTACRMFLSSARVNKEAYRLIESDQSIPDGHRLCNLCAAARKGRR